MFAFRDLPPRLPSPNWTRCRPWSRSPLC